MNITLKYLCLFLIWYPFRSLLRRLSVKQNAYHRLLKVGDLLGDLFFIAFPLGRRLIREQLESLELFRPGVVRKTFQHIMKVEMEGMVFEDLNRDLIEKITVFEGLHHLDQALDAGNGAVLILFHFGWNMHTIPALGYLGYPVKQIADPDPVDIQKHTNFFQRKVIEARLRNAANLPVEFVPAGSYLRPIIRTLEQNNILIVAIDGRQAKDFRAYPFFGKGILLSPLIIRVALKSKSQILPMVTFRGEDGKHRVIIHSPVVEKDPDATVLKILALLETYVRERPEQYAHYLLYNTLRTKEKGDQQAPLLVP